MGSDSKYIVFTVYIYIQLLHYNKSWNKMFISSLNIIKNGNKLI